MLRTPGAALVAIVVATLTACSSDPDDADRIATLEQQVDELVEENDELRERLDGSGTAASTVVGPDSVPDAEGSGSDAGEPEVDPAGAVSDDPALAVQRDLQAGKITLWALSEEGLIDVGDTWADAAVKLDNCDTWRDDPVAAQELLSNEFVTRVYRIVLGHYCPRFLPLLEQAAPPSVTVAELNATLGPVAVAWLIEPSRDTYDSVAAVAASLLERPLPPELSTDPARSATQSLRELTEYPGSDDAVREILDRLAIGEEYVEAEAATTTTATTGTSRRTSTASDRGSGRSTPTTTAAPVTVEELNAVLGPLVEEWVVIPNPDTYEAILAAARELLRRPLSDDLTDDDSTDPAEVLRSLIPYPGSDTEVISILDQLALDVTL